MFLQFQRFSTRGDLVTRSSERDCYGNKKLVINSRVCPGNKIARAATAAENRVITALFRSGFLPRRLAACGLYSVLGNALFQGAHDDEKKGVIAIRVYPASFYHPYSPSSPRRARTRGG